MKRQRVFSSLIMAGAILSITNILPLTAINYSRSQTTATAQTKATNPNEQLFYLYKGQRIPLTQQQDAVAVEFKPVANTRNPNPLYLQLEKDLQTGTGTRSSGASQVQIKPLGTNYAVVSLPKNNAEAIKTKIQSQSYVKASLPVLSRTNSKDTIVLPNEIIVNFQANMGEPERLAILKKNNLEVIRSLRFLPNIYIVKSTNTSGTAVLGVANQLNQIQGINSAAPNFLQSVPTFVEKKGENILDFNPQANISTQINQGLNKPLTNYSGLQWHLNSIPLQTCLQQNQGRKQTLQINELQACLQQQSNQKNKQTKSPSNFPRTDMRVTEAWQNSNGGKGVVVAVVDSLIQWNHPDLRNNLHKVTVADKCPGEEFGWDFSEPSNSKNPCEIGDTDTKMSPLELNILRRMLQDTFKLSDVELVKKYASPQELAYINKNKLEQKAADIYRQRLRSQVSNEFHGTMVSGVVAGGSTNSQAMSGVAPNAKILPVRVFGLGGSIQRSAVIEAIAYSANRGADVINLSLGGGAPIDAEEQAVQQILQMYPKLVIVASSGNESYLQVAYPSGYEGILSVGATSLFGDRASYSSFGKGLDLVAPGGDLETSAGLMGGIATTGGTWMDNFWQGLAFPNNRWGYAIDNRGQYFWTQGTSFSAPAVSGVIALMKGEDGGKKLTRDQIINILKSTASYDSLRLSDDEKQAYQAFVNKGIAPNSTSANQFFFGSGLINADAAVRAVKK